MQHIDLPIEWAHIRDEYGATTSNKKDILANQWVAYQSERYYITRWNITTKQLSLYDWNTYKKNYEHSHPTIQKFIIKMMTGWLPV